MRRPVRLRCRGGSEPGFALLIVLWTLVLIAFVVAQVAASGRTEMRIASNLTANTAAQVAADGAIYEAIFHLADPQPDRQWRFDGNVRELVIGNTRIEVTIEDEAGRINPNLASVPLLGGLLRAVGVDPERAADLTRAISEWVGSGEVVQPAADALAQYRAFGLDYGPPGAPLETIDELCGVRGMTAELCNLLRPHLTLFGPAQPNPRAADPVVMAAIELSSDGTSTLPDASSRNDAWEIVRIHANAEGPGNTKVGRVAVVRIGSLAAQRYAPLIWADEDGSQMAR